MGYKESFSTLFKFRKPNLPPQWNALFTILFKSFSERITGSDCASKLFTTLIYGICTRMNIDYGAVLWDKGLFLPIHQSAHSLDLSMKSCFKMFLLQVNSWKGSINFHLRGLGHLLQKCRHFLIPLINERKVERGQKKRLRKLKRRKQPARKRKTPTPSASEESNSDTKSDVRVETTQPIRNEEEILVRNEEVEKVHNQEPPFHNEEDTTNREVLQSVHDSVPSPPPSPKSTSIPITIAPFPPPVISSQPTMVPISTPILTTSTTNPITSTIPNASVNVSDMGATILVLTTPVSSSLSSIRNDDLKMIFAEDSDGDDLGGFTYSQFHIRTDSEDEASISIGKLKAIHEKLDQLLLASKASSSDSYSKAMVESLFERIMKAHEENAKKMNASFFFNLLNSANPLLKKSIN
ncbi:unnamed protein product [Lactuca saligna]|uniref:Uncharacterized protein n=1 Tax=Lactuca saligna TaxID=75948 RepID=A0AA36DZ47_LACSI|nr:unnamed protein product [Lactuca saligna]